MADMTAMLRGGIDEALASSSMAADLQSLRAEVSALRQQAEERSMVQDAYPVAALKVPDGASGQLGAADHKLVVEISQALGLEWTLPAEATPADVLEAAHIELGLTAPAGSLREQLQALREHEGLADDLARHAEVRRSFYEGEAGCREPSQSWQMLRPPLPSAHTHPSTRVQPTAKGAVADDRVRVPHAGASDFSRAAEAEQARKAQRSRSIFNEGGVVDAQALRQRQQERLNALGGTLMHQASVDRRGDRGGFQNGLADEQGGGVASPAAEPTVLSIVAGSDPDAPARVRLFAD